MTATDRPERPTPTRTSAEPEPTKTTAEPDPTDTTTKPQPTKTSSTPEPTPTISKPEPTETTTEPQPTETTSAPEPTQTSAKPEPTASDATEPVSDSSVAWWWLVLLVALVVLGALIWWLMGRRRTRAEWQATFDDAATKVDWLTEQPVTSVVAAPSTVAMEEAWREASAAISGVDEQLVGLHSSAPDEALRQLVADTRSGLERLRASLLALVEQARTGAGADEQRQRTVEVEQARVALRSVVRPEGTPT